MPPAAARQGRDSRSAQAYLQPPGGGLEPVPVFKGDAGGRGRVSSQLSLAETVSEERFRLVFGRRRMEYRHPFS